MRTCSILELTENTFDELVLSAAAPVFVYVGDRSCEACPFRGGICQRTAATYCVDAQQSPALLNRLDVTHFPTILLFRSGRIARRLVGHAFPDDLDLIIRMECAQIHRA